MIFEKSDDFINAAKKGKLLALDVSKNNIGLAVADINLEIVTPVGNIKRKKLVHDIAAIQKYITENNANGLVIGLPLNMDGSEGPRCQAVRQFARDILKTIDIPIIFFDERLSTFAAKEVMEENPFPNRKKAAAIDKLAASLILERFLEGLN